MGDDAIPHLLRILTPDSRLKQQADQLMKANPLKSHSPARHRSPATWEIEAARWTAGIAFHYLGNDASRPLDDLATLLENHQGTTSWENLSSIHGAAIAMAAIEPEGVDILIAHATGTDPILRNAAIEGLGYAHSPDSRHIILLLNHALDKNVQTRTLAIEALGRARKEPNQTVPLLIAGLKDPAIVAQILAARSLGWLVPMRHPLSLRSGNRQSRQTSSSPRNPKQPLTQSKVRSRSRNDHRASPIAALLRNPARQYTYQGSIHHNSKLNTAARRQDKTPADLSRRSPAKEELNARTRSPMPSKHQGRATTHASTSLHTSPSRARFRFLEKRVT